MAIGPARGESRRPRPPFDPALPGLHHLCLSVKELPASLRFDDGRMPLLGWRPRRSAQSTASVGCIQREVCHSPGHTL